MSKILKTWMLLAMMITVYSVNAQQPSNTISGTVKNNKNKEAVTSVSVSIKGAATVGTFTDDKGNFKLTTHQAFPITLVFSSIGYETKEVLVTSSTQAVTVDFEPSYAIGTEVTVSASRVSERILESPVSVERINATAIRNAATPNYYDMLANLKGVDVVNGSMTFKSVGTRGFNLNGNLRLNQLVDGMDNQAPGLNFAVGNIVGATELDVESMELLPGASSALYGSGGMNGTVLINSKNPFKYQGFSFQVKQGVSQVDIDKSQRGGTGAYTDWSLRWGKKLSEKFAYKIGAQFLQAQDWVGTDNRNYNRTYLVTGSTPNGALNPGGGTRLSDPNYDGVNTYGDETSSYGIAIPSFNIRNLTLNNMVQTFVGPKLVAAGAITSADLANIVSTMNGNTYVSRTGYAEKDIMNPNAVNVKLSGGLYYKIKDNLEASFTAYYGTGNSAYTGTDRYSLKELKIGQYKFELRSKNWFLRAYTTQENSGSSFDAVITTRKFNEALKPTLAVSGTSMSGWLVDYTTAYILNRKGGLDDANGNVAARTSADVGRPTGYIGDNPLFQQIASTPISYSKGNGGLFLDKSNLYVAEGQYNLTQALGVAKYGTDVVVGANIKQYVLNSQGTLFADSTGKIKINEVGAYAQISQKLFHDVLKLSVSGRYDKNSNFDGRFTPRASAVVKVAKDHNFRFSYQTAYRFPSTQNQWIDLYVSSGVRLIGGLPDLQKYYNLNQGGTTNTFTLASVQKYQTTGNPADLIPQTFGLKPESMSSFEVGYRGVVAKKLMIDAYAYWGKYKDFIGDVRCVQITTGTAFGTVKNLDANVNTAGWGVSLEYQMPKNFYVTGNVYSDIIGDVPADFVSYFNTPKYRGNIGFGNTGFLCHNRIGFNVTMRSQSDFYYQGTFGDGALPCYTSFDGMISYKVPNIKSLIKLGASNIANKYYATGFGSPTVGGVYYVSFAYNVF
jgi:outer membrane receptor protein involved in Fe transport